MIFFVMGQVGWVDCVCELLLFGILVWCMLYVICIVIFICVYIRRMGQDGSDDVCYLQCLCLFVLVGIYWVLVVVVNVDVGLFYFVCIQDQEVFGQ